MYNLTTEVLPTTVITDSTNPNYPNAVVSVYWKLITTWNENPNYFVRRDYCTELHPSFDENFIDFEHTNNSMIVDWIKLEMGGFYDTLVQLVEYDFYMNYMNPPEKSDLIKYYFYNEITQSWQSQQ